MRRKPCPKPPRHSPNQDEPHLPWCSSRQKPFTFQGTWLIYKGVQRNALLVPDDPSWPATQCLSRYLKSLPTLASRHSSSTFHTLSHPVSSATRLAESASYGPEPHLIVRTPWVFATQPCHHILVRRHLGNRLSTMVES